LGNIQNILKPKSWDDILKDINSENYVKTLKTLVEKMYFREKEDFFIPFISSNTFYPSEYNGIIFNSACRFGYKKLVKIMVEKENFYISSINLDLVSDNVKKFLLKHPKTKNVIVGKNKLK
jgi:hypothetical protein